MDEKIFVSYSHKDESFAEKLTSDFGRIGIELWRDSHGIKVGDLIPSEIGRALQTTAVLILVLSPESIKSAWIKMELAIALKRSETVTILPILYQPCSIPDEITHLEPVDFHTNYKSGLENLFLKLGRVIRTDKRFIDLLAHLGDCLAYEPSVANYIRTQTKKVKDSRNKAPLTNQLKRLFSVQLAICQLLEIQIDDVVLLKRGYFRHIAQQYVSKEQKPSALVLPTASKSPKTIFISHATEDAHFAELLANRLNELGFEPWLILWQLNVGDSIFEKINEALQDMDCFLIVMSPAAINSKWVKEELNAALSGSMSGRAVKVLPIYYQACTIPPLLSSYKYADFSQDIDDGWKQLLPSLGQEVQQNPKYEQLKNELEIQLADNSVLLDHIADKWNKIPDFHTQNSQLLDQLRRVSNKRTHLKLLIGNYEVEDTFYFANQRLPISSKKDIHTVTLGNLVSSNLIVGRITSVKKEYCERCGGIINILKVAPDLPFYLLSSAGCRCP